jgi:opacity protein-like surface antigen
MMMNKNIFFLLLALLLPGTLWGQKTDFGIWYEIQADYSIIKGLRFDLETSLRTDQDASNIESFYLEPGIRYKLNKYLSAGVYYRYIEQKEKDDAFHARHRWFFQVKGDLPVKRFTLSARYRLQEQFKTYIEDPEDEIPVWGHRLRLELDYDIKGLPLKPYTSAEIYSQPSEQNETLADRWRYVAGAEYTFLKKHTIGLEYVYNVSKVSKPAYMNIIGIKYGLSL